MLLCGGCAGPLAIRDAGGVIGAALSAILARGFGVICPIGGVNPLHLPRGAGVFLQTIGGEPQPLEPMFHRAMRFALGQGKGKHGLWLDLSMCARSNHNRRGAKRA